MFTGISTWVRKGEPRCPADDVSLNVSACQVAILGGVRGQDVADGENVADEPGDCDAKEHLQRYETCIVKISLTTKM